MWLWSEYHTLLCGQAWLHWKDSKQEYYSTVTFVPNDWFCPWHQLHDQQGISQSQDCHSELLGAEESTVGETETNVHFNEYTVIEIDLTNAAKAKSRLLRVKSKVSSYCFLRVQRSPIAHSMVKEYNCYKDHQVWVLCWAGLRSLLTNSPQPQKASCIASNTLLAIFCLGQHKRLILKKALKYKQRTNGCKNSL